MVWHSELKWFSTKSSWIFLNDLHTAMPLDSLLHFGIQLINIRYYDLKLEENTYSSEPWKGPPLAILENSGEIKSA